MILLTLMHYILPGTGWMWYSPSPKIIHNAPSPQRVKWCKSYINYIKIKIIDIKGENVRESEQVGLMIKKYL